MMRSELVNGKPIRCYDAGARGGADRYTIVFMNREEYGYTPEYIAQSGRDFYPMLGMSASPFHPQGIGQHSDGMDGAHLGKRIRFTLLPSDCQKLVLRDLAD